MLKVILKCHGSGDCRRVNLVLAKYDIPILKTTESSWSIDRRITIVVFDYALLNKILFETNQNTLNDVQVVKVKQLKEKKK